MFFFLRKIWWVPCFCPLPIFRRSGRGPVSIERLHLKDTRVSGCAVRALRLHAWLRRSTEGIDKTVQSAKAQSESVALLAADLRVPSVGPQPQHIASFNQATYSCNKETAKRLCMRMKRQSADAQLHEGSRAAEAACTSHHSLQTQVFAVREATRYSGLRSLHVVHGD